MNSNENTGTTGNSGYRLMDTGKVLLVWSVSKI